MRPVIIAAGLACALVFAAGRIKGIRLISLESLEKWISSFGEKDGI